MDISSKVQNTQDTIHRPQEAQEEGRPKCIYFDSYQKVDQNTYCSWSTKRLSIGSPNGAARKRTQGAEEVCSPAGRTII